MCRTRAHKFTHFCTRSHQLTSTPTFRLDSTPANASRASTPAQPCAYTGSALHTRQSNGKHPRSSAPAQPCTHARLVQVRGKAEPAVAKETSCLKIAKRTVNAPCRIRENVPKPSQTQRNSHFQLQCLPETYPFKLVEFLCVLEKGTTSAHQHLFAPSPAIKQRLVVPIALGRAITTILLTWHGLPQNEDAPAANLSHRKCRSCSSEQKLCGTLALWKRLLD